MPLIYNNTSQQSIYTLQFEIVVNSFSPTVSEILPLILFTGLPVTSNTPFNLITTV